MARQQDLNGGIDTRYGGSGGEGTCMHAYAKFRGVDLPHSSGYDTESGVRRSDGRSGHLSHGPYINVGRGSYTAAFYVRRDATSDLGALDVDVCFDHGAHVVANRRFNTSDILSSIAGLLKLDFELPDNVKNLEVRLYVPEGVVVEIRDLVIFRRAHTSWGLQ